MACEYGGIIRAIFTQSFENGDLLREIQGELAEVIPNTAFKYRGAHRFDELHLRDLPHMR